MTASVVSVDRWFAWVAFLKIASVLGMHAQQLRTGEVLVFTGRNEVGAWVA